MRFPVDAQLPERLCQWLREQGHEALYVPTLLTGETPDAVVAAYAADHGLTLISKDEDFTHRHLTGGYQLVWIRLGNASNRELLAWFAPRFPEILAALINGEALVEVR